MIVNVLRGGAADQVLGDPIRLELPIPSRYVKRGHEGSVVLSFYGSPD